jgi:predicted small integral membrane protein
MSGGALIIVVVAGILGILGGWLVPIIFKSGRPYGPVGDILVCTIVTVVVAFLSWNYIMPALGFESGWIKVLGSTGDPLFLGLISLWVMRKIKG